MSSPQSGGGSRLGAQFLRSSIYMGVGNWSTYALNFIISLAIARILGPEEFGLYAFVLVVNEFFLIIGALAIGPALIQSSEESQSLYDTALVIAGLQGLAAIVLSIALAPVLAHFRSPEAGVFLVVLGFSRAMNLVSVVPSAQLERAVRYGRVAAIRMASSNLPNFLALGLAWWGVGAWSLVARDVAVQALLLGLCFAWSPYRFRFAASREASRKIMAFSKPMFLARTLDIVVQRLDRITVGSVFGNTSLGLYHQGRNVAEVGMMAARPLFSLSFNLYSRVRDTPARLSRSYGLINYFLARALSAGAVVFLIFPEETIRLLLGREWLAAAPVLQALGLYAALLPLFLNMKELLFARAEALKSVRIRLVQTAVFLPGVLAAAYFESVVGIAFALTLSVGVAIALTARYAQDIVRQELAAVFLVPALAVAGTVASFAAFGDLAGVQRIWWPLRLGLPPLVFGALVVAAERGRLLREFRFLRRQLRSRTPAEAPTA